MRVLVSNQSATYDYEIEDKLQAGIVLQGWEVKSVKAGRVNLKGSFVHVDANLQMWLRGMHVANWVGQQHSEIEKGRDRLLLVHKTQASKLGGMGKRPGYSVVPLQIIETDGGLIKVEIALVKGKRKYDKRRAIKEREIKRELRQSW